MAQVTLMSITVVVSLLWLVLVANAILITLNCSSTALAQRLLTSLWNARPKGPPGGNPVDPWRPFVALALLAFGFALAFGFLCSWSAFWFAFAFALLGLLGWRNVALQLLQLVSH